MFRFVPSDLQKLAASRAHEYREAKPFPHIVIDDLFPPEVLDGVLAEYPGVKDINWKKFADATGKKLATKGEEQIGDAAISLIWQLNSSIFVSFLETLTGITGLLPDPHLWGGGLHQIQRGGFLRVHADFNKHERLNLDRRLNLLVYLNKNWDESYGGHLELWSRDMKSREKRVLPLFNRCVVFSTTDTSYHGHPDPVTCPEGWTRKSVALYYYTNGRPLEEVSESHSTLYRERPGESIFSMKARLKALAQRITKG